MAARIIAPGVAPSAAPMPYLNFTPPKEAFGGGGTGGEALAQGVGKLGSALGDIAREEKAKDDEVAVLQADTALSDAIRERMFGKDGSSGFYGTKGQATVDGYSQVGPDLDAIIKQHADQFGSDVQRRAFMAGAEHRRKTELDAAVRHTAVQRTKMLDDVSDARVSSSILDGAMRFNLDEERDSYYRRGGREIIDQGTRNGWAPEQTRLKLQQYASDFHSAAIERALEADPIYAKKLFDDNKTLLLPDKLTRVEAEVQQKTKLLEVDRVVAAARSMVPAQTGAVTGAAPDLATAIHQQESGGRPGDYQIQPGTWEQYAKPGESIGNPADQKAVYGRILADLNARAGGDPARVAVGYFSGPGNIAPPGSPTPWKEDRADRNGKTVSSYVADIQKRLSGAPTESSRADAFAVQRQAVINDASLKPDVREAALARIEHDHAQENAIENQRDREARRQVQELVLSKKLDPMAVPNELQTRVGPEFMTHMKAAYTRDGAVPFNAVIESQLHELAIRDPAKFADPDQTDLTKHIGQHDQKRLLYWMAQQRQMATAESRASLRQPSYALGDKIAGELFPYSTRDKDRAERDPTDDANPFNRQARVKAAMRSWLDAYHDEHKKPPTSDEVYRFGRSLRLQTTDGGWFSSTAPRIDTIGTGAEVLPLKLDRETVNEVVSVTGIPRDAIPEVAHFLRMRGIPLTYESMIKTYSEGKKKQATTQK